MAEQLFSPNELVDLAIALIALPVLLRSVRSGHSRGLNAFMWGYLALTAALFATIAEGLFWAHQLNVAEHAMYAVSGCMFLFGAFRMSQSPATD